MSIATVADKRYIFIDYLKGILIILVILGHLLPNSLEDNFCRYIIYSFHMPLFLFVSGYLLTQERIRNYTAKSLITKYFKRMLVPWIIAFIVFMGLQLYLNLISVDSLKQAIYYCLYPWYHLWFIPALLGMILFLYIIQKLNFNIRNVLYLSFVFTFFWMIYQKENLIYASPLFLGDKRMFYYFCFFCLGYCMRNKIIITKLSRINSLILVCSLFVLRAVDFYVSFPSIVSVPIFIIANILLCLFILTMLENNRLPLKREIVFLGVNSLPLYLWHVLPIWLMRVFELDIQQPLLFYFTQIILLIVFVKLLDFVQKQRLFKIFLIGVA